MTDPWEDVREKATTDDHDGWCISWANEHPPCDCHLADLRGILSDAEALLAVVPKLEFLAEIKGSFCIYPDKEIEHVGAAVVREIAKKTIATLPDHLRAGESR